MHSQFDIIAVKFPFSDDVEQFKVRPAIIISNSNSNKLDKDFLLCPITTQIRKQSFSYALEGKTNISLPSKSEIRCNKIATVRQNYIIKKVTELKAVYHQELIEVILQAIKAT